MILGIGTDLLDIRRIERILDLSMGKTSSEHRQRFIDRVFTPHEQKQAQSGSETINRFAKMFAAKEAVAKALGTGIAKGVSWQDIEIQRETWSPPKVQLSGKALEVFNHKIPSGRQGVIHLSITDEAPYCQAFVILSTI